MYQQRYQTDKRRQDCYICGSYKKRTADCTAHFIRTDLLTEGAYNFIGAFDFEGAREQSQTAQDKNNAKVGAA